MMCVLGIISSLTLSANIISSLASSIPFIFGGAFWISLLLPKDTERSDTLEYVLIYLTATIMGVLIGVFATSTTRIGVYALFMSYFHFSEFYYVTLSTGIPSFDSFLINHGKEYATAFTISMFEYYLFPLHSVSPSLIHGGIASFSGLFLRAIAMLTAGSGFTHLIARQKSHNHSLITHGVYAYMRHPGYCGWLIWVIGSQLILDNPVCLVLFTVITWKFFSQRIPYEERLLVDFFGQEYITYRLRTRFSGVPFIH
jgi:protein-S-isoprenylcysteine O-methyltransferase